MILPLRAPAGARSPVRRLTVWRRVAPLLLAVTGLVALRPAQAAAPESLLGAWELTIENGAAGWLELRRASDGGAAADVLWASGSVQPMNRVTFEGGEATLVRDYQQVQRDAAGRVTGEAAMTDTFTVALAGETLRVTRETRRADDPTVRRATATGRRAPPLPPRPDLSQIAFGEPVQLLTGPDLSGWRLLESDAANGWRLEGGVLRNDPQPAAAGQPRPRYGNLRSEREFEDFRLTLEVNVPAGSNSGMYLRGIYEVQVADSYGRAPDSHHLGAIYSRLTPRVAAEKPAGEWQTLEITLVQRHVTVVLNGTVILDNQPLAGCTGGALWADVTRPGPLVLQGDHGPVAYRGLVLRPVQAAR